MVNLAPSKAHQHSKPRWGLGADGLICAAVALTLFAVALVDPRVLGDGDSWWHLATGGWILDHGRVPTTDPFSFTHLGQPWVAHEWLSELLMALAWRVGGWSGVAILTGACFALTAGLLGRALGRSLSGLSLAFALVLSFALGAGSLLARPHTLAAPFIVLWLDQLIEARRAGRAPPLWLAATMVVWANLHGSFVFGFVLSAPFGLEALWDSRARPWPAIKAWGAFGLATLAAALVTPHGVEAFLYPLQINGMQTLGDIREWRPQDFSKPGAFELALMAVLFIGFSRGVRIPPLRLALLLVILHMALEHERHALVLGLAAPLLLAEPFAVALQARPAQARGWAVWIVTGALMCLLAAVRLAVPIQRTDGPTVPATALAHVPTALAAKPVLNTYGFGGYLIFHGVRPFIDGRSDMYGDQLFRQHTAMTNGDVATFDAAAARWGLAWTLLAPDEPLAHALDHHPGWTRLYGDRWAVVHVRTSKPQPNALPVKADFRP